MGGLYENVRKDQKTKKDTWVYVVMAAAVCLLVIGIAVGAWVLGYQKRFTKFISNLSNSTTYAYNNNSMTAEIDGQTIEVSAENMYGIFAYLSLNKSGRESSKPPAGDAVTLDYGNGAILKLWDMPAEEGHHDMFIHYTDAQGYTYSYISYKTTLETVVVRYLTYGNDEGGD